MLTLVLWSLSFVLIGAVLYNADYYYGTSWYRRWYDATHGETLPENTRKGFVVGRNARARFIFATFAVLFKIAATILIEGGLHPLYEFLMWPVEVASLVVGFYLGPFVYEQWRKKDKAFAYLDKVEKGEVSVVGDLKRGVKTVGDKATAKIIEFKTDSLPKKAEVIKKETSNADEPKPQSLAPKSQVDPMAAVKKFTDKY